MRRQSRPKGLQDRLNQAKLAEIYFNSEKLSYYTPCPSFAPHLFTAALRLFLRCPMRVCKAIINIKTPQIQGSFAVVIPATPYFHKLIS